MALRSTIILDPTSPNFRLSDCTLSTCPIQWAELLYDPSLAGNVLFLSIFSLLLTLQVILGWYYRTTGMTVAISIGLALEIVGYTGRILMHYNPFLKANFLLYLIPLTIGPVFLAAAVYLCLSRIVVVYSPSGGKGFSMLRPRTYTLLFIGCDIMSLALQAIGGAVAAEAESRPKAKLHLL
jgi:hypothetical protein